MSDWSLSSIRAALAATAAELSTSPPSVRLWPPGPVARWPSTAIAGCRVAAGAPTCSKRSACRSICRPTRPVSACESIGIAFLFAPHFHPALRNLESVRRQLGFRTIFNLVGPLANPARVRRQVIGVFDRSLVRTLADVLLRFGADHVLVVHGDDGSDEITTLGVTHICELHRGAILEFDIRPEELGVNRGDERLLAGGSAAENAEIAQRILNGDRTPARDIVVLNAAAAIYVAGAAETLAAGVQRAAESIDSGSARNKLDQLRQFRGAQPDERARHDRGTQASRSRRRETRAAT